MPPVLSGGGGEPVELEQVVDGATEVEFGEGCGLASAGESA